MITAEDLRAVQTFSDLSEADLNWLSGQAEDVWLETGDALFRPGDKAEFMYVFLEGRAEFSRPDGVVFPIEAGDITGILPFSRLEKLAGTGNALTRTRVARFHRGHFWGPL